MARTDSWSTANPNLGSDIEVLAISGAAIEGTAWQSVAERNCDWIHTSKYRRITFFLKATETLTSVFTWKWQTSADDGTTAIDVTRVNGTALTATTINSTKSYAYSIPVVGPLMRINFDVTTADGSNYFTWNICRVELQP